ncbi:UPF0400 protein [Canna indica]|uniref:UPF0400 protein n=1 Tax=Canna indica TaxID=4628 RepID=A0AAQ3Q5B9_9LILI|nr:UPF0400 protein [Canna indica]
MNGSFNGQILVEKLAKLNNSQQSIETLSHWCIFHRNKAKQVVEIWGRQFQCSPREQRISFLYLANDILQNSRRKGLEFINEFWKVLPDALADVFGSGDDFGRKTVLRLVDIWEERKVFGSRGQTLKEDILGRKLDDKNTNEKPKLKQSGEFLEKIISSYDHVCDEGDLFGKCQDAISIVDKVEREIGGDVKSGNINRPEITRELGMQQRILGECIEQLKAAESSRVALLSILREALHEQEIRIEQVHNLLEAAESRYKQAGEISAVLNREESLTEQRPVGSSSAFSDIAPGFAPEAAASFDKAQMTLPRITQEESHADNNSSHKEEEDRKTAAAVMAAKLTSSSSSAQMLSLVLSSLASEGVIGQTNKEDYAPESKRPKYQNVEPFQFSSSLPLLQPPMPPFPHPQSLHQLSPLQPPSPMTHPCSNVEPPSSSFPPTPAAAALPSTTQFAQTAAGPMMGIPYSYGSAPLPNYPMLGLQSNSTSQSPYNGFQVSEGVNLLAQPPLPTAPPPLTRE